MGRWFALARHYVGGHVEVRLVLDLPFTAWSGSTFPDIGRRPSPARGACAARRTCRRDAVRRAARGFGPRSGPLGSPVGYPTTALYVPYRLLRVDDAARRRGCRGRRVRANCFSWARADNFVPPAGRGDRLATLGKGRNLRALAARHPEREARPHLGRRRERGLIEDRSGLRSPPGGTAPRSSRSGLMLAQSNVNLVATSNSARSGPFRRARP
jgi:hypothetical protein